MCSATSSLCAAEKYCSKLHFNIHPHVIFNSIPKTRLIINNLSSAVVRSEDADILELTHVRYPRIHRNYGKKTFMLFGLVYSGHMSDIVRNASFTSVYVENFKQGLR
jgi:hypothetical protein